MEISLNQIDKSQGQLCPNNDFAKIEQEILNELKNKNKHSKDNQMVQLDKISPALIQLQNISHHNLYVAQNYQARAMNLEEQLKRLLIENEGIKEMFDQMKSQYEKKMVGDEKLIDELQKEKAKYQNGYIVLEKKNQEYEKIVNESRNFIEEQKKIIQFLEGQYKDAWDKYQKDCEKLQKIVGKANSKISTQAKEINELKLQMITNQKTAENRIQSLEESNRNVQKNYESINQKYNQKENQWKVDAIESEKRQALLNERSEQINQFKKENEKLRDEKKELEFRNEQVNGELNQLKEQFDNRVQEKMKSISDNFCNEITKKDIQIVQQKESLDQASKEKKQLTEKLNKQERELKQKEQEQKELQNQLQIEQQQIEDFNTHYEQIKDQYEGLVKNLQKELMGLQQKNLRLTDEYETCLSQLETLRKKEEVFENFRKYKQDETYVTLLKNAQDDVYLKGLTQEELDSIKVEAREEINKDKLRNKLLEQYEQNEKAQEQILGSNEAEDQNEMENQWEELTKNLNKFSSEVASTDLILRDSKNK